MRRTDSRSGSGRVLAPLCTAGLALALIVALSPVVRALPVGGSAYYVFLGNFEVSGFPFEIPD
ncbi:MAG: hypothetical protein GEU99_24665, partial [Luteitalea sp.]|nr:hypothetical protein [Luteitalea sp.]